jgi:BlaI family transcriptional regulator, penicillinase repressor
MENKILPTDAELEILQLLWMSGPSTVRSIHDIIVEKRDVGYTSTLKIMQIMLDKGMLSREILDRVHFYSANIDESLTQKKLLDEFVETTFRGSTSSMMMSMLGDGNIDLSDLQKIKAMIADIEKNSQNI